MFKELFLSQIRMKLLLRKGGVKQRTKQNCFQTEVMRGLYPRFFSKIRYLFEIKKTVIKIQYIFNLNCVNNCFEHTYFFYLRTIGKHYWRLSIRKSAAYVLILNSTK